MIKTKDICAKYSHNKTVCSKNVCLTRATEKQSLA